MWMTWREAMRTGLYGPAGFYARGEPPSRHFRTSAHVSSAYAGAMLSLLHEADAALGRPGRLDLVDVGAGRGEHLLRPGDRHPGQHPRGALHRGLGDRGHTGQVVPGPGERGAESGPDPPGADDAHPEPRGMG